MTRSTRKLLLILAISSLLATPLAQGLDTQRADVQAFMAEMVQNDGFEVTYLTAVFSGIELKQSIIDAMRRPAEKTKTWSEYGRIFLTPARISGGVDFFGSTTLSCGG